MANQLFVSLIAGPLGGIKGLFTRKREEENPEPVVNNFLTDEDLGTDDDVVPVDDAVPQEPGTGDEVTDTNCATDEPEIAEHLEVSEDLAETCDECGQQKPAHDNDDCTACEIIAMLESRIKSDDLAEAEPAIEEEPILDILVGEAVLQAEEAAKVAEEELPHAEEPDEATVDEQPQSEEPREVTSDELYQDDQQDQPNNHDYAAASTEDEPCQAEEACSQEEACTAMRMSLVERKERKEILGQEIADLKACIQPLLDEMSAIVSGANTDYYADPLARMEEKIAEFKELDAQLQERIAEYESIRVNECCEAGFTQADKFCYTCGDYIGELGWLCTACPTHNKGCSMFCRGCGKGAEATEIAPCDDAPCEESCEESCQEPCAEACDVPSEDACEESCGEPCEEPCEESCAEGCEEPAPEESPEEEVQAEAPVEEVPMYEAPSAYEPAPVEEQPAPRKCTNSNCGREYPEGNTGTFCRLCGWVIR